MARKKVERKVTEDPRYHNTWKLLKKYRDVVWSLEPSIQQFRSSMIPASRTSWSPSIWPARIWAARTLSTRPGALSAATKC